MKSPEINVIVTRNFVNGGYTSLDITDLVEQVQWSGSKYGAPRSLEVNLTVYGATKFVPEDDDYLFLRVSGKEVFRGKVFSYGFSTNKKVTMKAYDNLIYLTKNKDNKIFLNKTATQIITTLCKDFKIGIGTIANTGYTIQKSVYQNVTLYDMFQKALDVTRKAKSTRYHISSSFGKINVLKKGTVSAMWEIDEKTNLIDYSRSVSMENVSTRVKLEAEFEKESTKKDSNAQPIKTVITSIVNDKDLASKFGILQYYEKVTEELNKKQLEDRAKKILKEQSKIEKTFSLNALGIPTVISGGMVQVIVSEIGIKKGYYIDQDTHTFTPGKYTMSLTLTETDELPEITVEDPAKEEKKKEDDKKKAADKKKKAADGDKTEWEEAGEDWRDKYE